MIQERPIETRCYMESQKANVQLARKKSIERGFSHPISRQYLPCVVDKFMQIISCLAFIGQSRIIALPFPSTTTGQPVSSSRSISVICHRSQIRFPYESTNFGRCTKPCTRLRPFRLRDRLDEELLYAPSSSSPTRMVPSEPRP